MPGGGGWADSDRRQRLPADWPQLRAQALERDGHRCRKLVDGTRCTSPATDVDHIVAGDDHSLANLQSLCSYHHRRKSSSEGGRARAAKHSTRRPPERHPGLL